MKEPSTPEEVAELHAVLRSDPQRYLEITNKWIEQNPRSATAYFDRHQAWMRLAQPERALADLNKAIELEPDQTSIWSRGDVFRHIGDYEQAKREYARAEAIDPENWEKDAMPLLYQADVHARLGDEAAALSCCSRLPDHFWTPGPNNLPPGDKAGIADELRRRAGRAKPRTAGGGV